MPAGEPIWSPAVAGRIYEVAELHFRLRHELFGISTCTLLNDLLRSVADAEALIDVVHGG
jgi:hypothetical protein